MDIFIYTDESGVFDKVHNKYFVFGGIAFLSKEEKDIASRKYSSAEKVIRDSKKYDCNAELKASILKPKDKRKLYRSLNNYYKFGIIIRLERVFDRIFNDKKDKQRYQDYAYKIGVKKFLKSLIDKGVILEDGDINIHFFTDEHTTATNGRYELREGIEKELKRGQYNESYSIWYPPLFKNLHTIDMHFCKSSSTRLIRSADIIANNVFHKTIINSDDIKCEGFNNNLYICKFP